MKIGILGGGQLARMLAIEAHRLGLEPIALDPKPGCPADAVARTLSAAWDDPSALDELARCDVVTYEFENVPTPAVEALAERVRVRPAPEALRHTGDRLLEKQLLASLGIPTAAYRAVDTEDELRQAVRELGLPAVLKTRRLGYDGRGQAVLRDEADIGEAWRRLGGQALILEEFVAFDRELSLVAVRSLQREVRFWDPTQNAHVDGILRVSSAPAVDVSEATLARARFWVTKLLSHLGYVGVAAVEFFAVGNRWLVNEVACRVHNSGHWTIEGACTSQFENHVRAIAGLPLGSTRTREPAAMINLIAELPPRDSMLGVEGARLHCYGKTPAPGRKLGHVTVTSETSAGTEERVRELVRRIADPALQQALALGESSGAPSVGG